MSAGLTSFLSFSTCLPGCIILGEARNRGLCTSACLPLPTVLLSHLLSYNTTSCSWEGTWEEWPWFSWLHLTFLELFRMLFFLLFLNISYACECCLFQHKSHFNYFPLWTRWTISLQESHCLIEFQVTCNFFFLNSTEKRTEFLKTALLSLTLPW